MNKQEFESLKVGDKLQNMDSGDLLEVKIVNYRQGLINPIVVKTGHNNPLCWYRYENVELVEEDKLVEYLNSSLFSEHTSDEKAQEIRKIVREEFVNDLKFPTYYEFGDYYKSHSLKETCEGFKTRIKELNR